MQPHEQPEEPATDAPLHRPSNIPRDQTHGLNVGPRLPIATTGAFVVGMVMGAAHGGTKAAFKFRAENAHRFPTTSTGWYQYHKSKNYITMVGGIKEGIKMGSKLGAGTMAFCVFEGTVNRARHGQSDFLSSITAGLSISGVYSVLARHDMYTTARTVKLGLKMSLAYGLLQDAVSTLKGDRPRYIEFMLKKKNEYTGGGTDNMMR